MLLLPTIQTTGKPKAKKKEKYNCRVAKLLFLFYFYPIYIYTTFYTFYWYIKLLILSVVWNAAWLYGLHLVKQQWVWAILSFSLSAFGAPSSHFPNDELVETLTVVQPRNESSGTLILALWWGSNGVFTDRHLCLCSQPSSLHTHTRTHTFSSSFHHFCCYSPPLPLYPSLLFLSPPSSVLNGSHSPHGGLFSLFAY